VIVQQGSAMNAFPLVWGDRLSAGDQKDFHSYGCQQYAAAKKINGMDDVYNN
jgi:hypothetical protein